MKSETAKNSTIWGTGKGDKKCSGRPFGWPVAIGSQQNALFCPAKVPHLTPPTPTHRKVRLSGKVAVNLSTRKIAPVETIGQGTGSEERGAGSLEQEKCFLLHAPSSQLFALGIGGRLLGNKAANDTGLWIARLVAAPILAASLAGTTWSQEFDPFEAPPAEKTIQPLRRTPAPVSPGPSAAAAPRRLAYQQRPLQAPYRTENPWSAGAKFVEPANERHVAAPQQRKRPVTHASHAGPQARKSLAAQAAFQEEKPSTATTTTPTTEVLPNPAPGEIVEGEWSEGELGGSMEFDGGWDSGSYGCGDPACSCGAGGRWLR